MATNKYIPVYIELVLIFHPAGLIICGPKSSKVFSCTNFDKVINLISAKNKFANNAAKLLTCNLDELKEQ